VLGDRWRGNGSDSREGQERGGREGEQAALRHRAIDRESQGAPAPQMNYSKQKVKFGQARPGG
jgi:hypothetical protein